MYKTFYVKFFLNEDITGLLTKAENKKDALRKLNHYLRNHYLNFSEIKLKEYDIFILNKTEIINFS